MQHYSDVEALFRGPLDQIRTYAVVFAVQHSYDQMNRAVFYRVDEEPVPENLSNLVRLHYLHWDNN
jgi:hypothetical protein